MLQQYSAIGKLLFYITLLLLNVYVSHDRSVGISAYASRGPNQIFSQRFSKFNFIFRRCKAVVCQPYFFFATVGRGQIWFIYKTQTVSVTMASLTFTHIHIIGETCLKRPKTQVKMLSHRKKILKYWWLSLVNTYNHPMFFMYVLTRFSNQDLFVSFNKFLLTNYRIFECFTVI